MEIVECKLDGEGGELKVVGGQQVWPWERTPLHQPLRFQIHQLPVQSMFDLMGVEGLPAIVSKPGAWSGEIQFSNPESWQVDGALENVEVFFSNQSVRGRQVISRAKTFVKSEDGRIQMELSDFALADGGGQGKVSFQFDSGWRDGEWTVDISDLAFNSAVESLMTGGQASPIKFSGHGKIVGGEVRSWKGLAQWKSMEGRGWQVKDPRLDTDFQDGKFTAKLHMQEAELTPEFAFNDELKTVMGDQPAPWKFLGPAATVLINKSGGEIKEMRARSLGHSYSFRGSWERGGDLTGQVFDGAKHWNVRGAASRLSVEEE